MNTFRPYLAEFVGTSALVFCGTGAIVIDQVTGGTVGTVGIGITFGAIVMAMIYSFGPTSGAHINPAVTIALATAGLFDKSKVAGYLISQILGGLVASLVLRLLFPENEDLGMSLPSGSVMQSFVLELILTFLLMFTILQMSTGTKSIRIFTGLVVGAVVMMEAIFAGPICGASMNPARSIGPAVVAGHYEHLWIYIVATILGAMLAVLVLVVIRKTGSSE